MGIHCGYRVLVCAFFGLTSTAALAAKVVEQAEPYRNFRTFKQYHGENICWALAGRAIMTPLLGKSPAVCEVIGRATGNSCCSRSMEILPSCNKSGHATNVYNAFKLKYTTSGPQDYAKVFQTLKNRGLVSMTMDASQAAGGSRQGHEAVIYRGRRFADGHYQFDVADSSFGYYSFRTKDLKALPNGKLRYVALAMSFDWERATHVLRP